jgi:hypothetical protein
MKRIAMLMLAVLPAVAAAQSQPSPADQARKATDKMKTELALTPEQEGLVYDAHLAFFTQTAGTQGQPDRADVRKEAAKVRQASLKNVLTPEQMAQLKKRQKEMAKKARRSKMQRADAAPQPAEAQQ